MSTVRDVVIVGGGPVGASLALALRDSGLSLTLLEARTEAAEDDRRSLALSYGSRLILERLGAWERISPLTSIETIHVSQRGGFGRALLRAVDAGAPALGYVAPYGAVQRALTQALHQYRALELLQGARAVRIDKQEDAALIHYEWNGQSKSIAARLAVLSDGGALALECASQRTHDYHQTAVVANVSTDRPHRNRAFERFASVGPIALLPAGEGYALVWTTQPAAAEQLCNLNASEFLEKLQAHFGDRASNFISVEGRATFPLSMRVAGPPKRERVTLLGNAAQTLHPVAGQGLNLGLRDAWELAEQILSQQKTLGNVAFCSAFHASRRGDRTTSLLLTDTLVRGFSNDLAPFRWLRGCGLTMLDSLPRAKRGFMDRMMFGA
jgi:2-octaprenyl-6-methoxyphenol hydroxylase